MSAVERELKSRIAQLGPGEKRRLLDYARTLERNSTRGVPGPDLFALAGSLSEEEAREMLQVIEESFERIDPDAW
jgi:hypothetical protein